MNLQFLSMTTSISKILNLTNYDLKNNFRSWFNLLWMQAAVVVILLLHRNLPGSFIITCPDIFFGTGSFQFTLGTEYFSLGSDLTSLLMCIKVFLAALCEYLFHILFPIMILQNALDLAFDSSMRGFSIKGSLLSYVFAVHGFFFCRNLVVSYSNTLVRYIYQSGSMSLYYMIGFCVACVLACAVYAYVFQTLRFVGVHIFEYQMGIKKSMYASYEMTRGKMLFLSMISVLQILVITGISICSSYLVDFVVYVFNLMIAMMPMSLLSVDIYSFALDTFIIIISTIFWSLLMTWYYLIEVHTYRQLVCPSVENPTCDSCECAS